MQDTTRELSQSIEQLVREHMAAVERGVREAVERAFARTAGTAAGPARKVGPAPARQRRPSESHRRSRSEVSALGERLYQTVCAHPGEGIAVLASKLGTTATELQRPMALLRQAERVRSVGQRHQTRYFPRTGASS